MLGACLVALSLSIDLRDLGERLRAVDAASLSAAFVLIVLAIAISYLRMRAAIGLFAPPPGHGLTARAFVVGQVSNQLLANIVGQSISRAALLQAGGVPVSVTVFATFIERAVAALSLLGLSIAAVMLTMGRFAIDLERGGFYLVGLAAGGLAAMLLLAAVLVLRHGRELAHVCTRRHALGGLAVLVSTLLGHAAMLAAYLVVLAGLGIDVARAEIAGALLVVMFTASLPISFGGWGLRELSAAHALGLVGVPAAGAVAGSAIVGLIALAATLLPAAALFLLRSSITRVQPIVSAAPGARSKQSPLARARTGAAWDRRLSWVCALVVASLVFFQVRVPLSHGEINVNAADLFASIALVIAAAGAILHRGLDAALGWLWRGLALLTALLFAGLAIGYASHGWNDWAFLNRGLGWIVLLGYAVAGAAAGNHSGDRGRGTVLLVFACMGVAVCLAQVLLLEIDRFVVRVPHDLLAYPLEGFARNRNAFAFQVLLLLVALAVLLRAGVIGWRAHAAACGIAFIVVWETLSRTGWIVAAMLIFVLALNVEGKERARFLVRMAAGLAAMLTLYLAASYALAATAGADLGGAMLATVNRHEGLVVRPDADGERLGTLLAGLKLWLAHPLTGSGLGGYVAARAAAGQPFQVIHSVPVWLLAELGLLGCAVALIVAADWIARARQALLQPGAQPWAMGLLAILVVMAVAGLIHDFLYQRGFWFLLGLFAAGMSRAALVPTRSERPAG